MGREKEHTLINQLIWSQDHSYYNNRLSCCPFGNAAEKQFGGVSSQVKSFTRAVQISI